MAYYSGNAASHAALVAAIQAACVAEGWTLNGTVLSKSGCFFRVWADTYANAYPYIVGSGSAPTSPAQTYLWITGGTGVDGSSNLTGKLNSAAARLGNQYNGTNVPSAPFAFAFPVDYEIFIHGSPDEVYVVVNHDGDMYQHLAFGHSPLAQSTGGTGAWFGASFNPIPNASNFSAVSTANWIHAGAAWMSGGGNIPAWADQAPAPLFFAWSRNASNSASATSLSNMGDSGSPGPALAYNYWVHQGVDSVGWLHAGSALAAFPMLIRGPNVYNSNAPLIRAVAAVQRAATAANYTPVVEVEHARLLRIDNYTPEDIITLGSDQWKVFPFFQRNLALPAGSNSAIRHTGALGWAVRYDGP